MSYHILIVDDEPIVRNGLQSFDWETYGFACVGACGNGREALAWLSRNAADVVLTDIKMPGIDGVELSGLIRERYPDMLVILLTGYNEFAYAQQAIKTGVFDYLLKPAEDADFATVLANCARKLQEREQSRQVLSALAHQDWASVAAVVKKIIVASNRINAWSPGKIEEYLADILEELESGQIAEPHIRQLLLYLISSLETGLAKASLLPNEHWTAAKEECAELVRTASRFGEIKSALAERMARFAREMQDAHARVKASAKLEEALAYIHRHYAGVLSLDLMAERLRMHPNFFSKWFKENKGINFIDYVTHYRMDKARELLEHTDLKAGEIAESAGIPDARYFGQVFKKYVGLTPTEYRALFR